MARSALSIASRWGWRIHALFAARAGQDMAYEALLAPLDGFAAAVRRFAADGGKGLNVTVPFKEEAFRLAGRLTERARAAGAVNTLSFGPGDVGGDNTDGAGLVRDLRVNLGFPVEGRRVLLLGAGGAARGVILPLLGLAALIEPKRSWRDRVLRAGLVALAALGAWAAVNLPVALAAPANWAEFYLFSQLRSGTAAGTWDVSAALGLLQLGTPAKNLIAAIAFAVGALLIVALG